MRAAHLLLPLLLPVVEAQETLRYTINWPSGLSLGEATLESRTTPGGRDLKLSIDASIPGFAVVDQFTSVASSPARCSVEFEKNLRHGSRKTVEKMKFAQRKATRETVGGGRSILDTGDCARDALSFLDFVRAELRQGRIPPAQTIYFGGPYQISLQLAGQSDLVIGSGREVADRLVARLKGPASDRTFELFFGRDADRRLLKVRLPLPLGSFDMELVP